jgi:hypothetical protein
LPGFSSLFYFLYTELLFIEHTIKLFVNKMFCPKCGKEVPVGSSFCAGCGAQMRAQEVQQPAEPVQQAAPVIATPTQTAPHSYSQPVAYAQPKQSGGGSKLPLIIAIVAIVAVVLILAVFFLMDGLGGGGIEGIICNMQSAQYSGQIKFAEQKAALDLSGDMGGQQITVKGIINPSGVYLNVPMLGNTWYKIKISDFSSMAGTQIDMARLDAQSIEQMKQQIRAGSSPAGMSCSISNINLGDFELPAGAQVQEGLPFQV